MKILDAVVIYTVTLFPIVHWHLTGPHQFNWFVDNDFVYVRSPIALTIAEWIYRIVLLAYSTIVVVHSIKQRSVNLSKLLLVAGTAISWYAGIVYFKGDLTFTLLNVVSHGIPYISLVWFAGKRKATSQTAASGLLSKLFTPWLLPVFVGIILVFAYAEEFLWDQFVWHEHPEIFGMFNITAEHLLRFIVPLLSVPQFTHYVIDGFIWKIKSDTYQWSQTTLNDPPG